ncbi:MAG TPA: 3-isopropylmalate dehydrogenase, partial [Paludibacteraceae bacterium]|nr:3-isopropylmalate dehydrogenase [Paludibacteraceae bacterium]
NNPTATVRPEQGLLAMRKKLGLYANIRPVKAFETILSKSPLREELVRDTDFLVIRELTGGLYFGQPRGISEDGNTAIDTCAYSREEIERIIQLAYSFAQKRRRKVTVVDKANILATSQLWRKIAQEIAPKHPDITTEYLFVDNAAMQLIQNPKTFDVLVTENMFGDILTDEASVITGSLGMLPSASIGLHTSVFEPIHGSYPQAAGKNIANPIAMVLSAALMFEYAFNLNAESQLIRQAVDASIANGIVTVDIAFDKSYTTTEVGQWLVNYINKATI